MESEKVEPINKSQLAYTLQIIDENKLLKRRLQALIDKKKRKYMDESKTKPIYEFEYEKINTEGTL